ncbi:MAG: 16S rRNA (cytosine(1402)-N(4))-methyltransferase RsmH [Deltaproteobacteria bacterium]|nr:16S rRNA (cytosine(1402)-N(4))-methyltransferase RsmH [Deltaproteobacteria bacterium]
MDEVLHVPVLVEETICNLVDEKTEVFVDATMGLGGHSYEILRRFDRIKVVGFDVDEDELEIAKERLKEFGNRVFILRENYRNMANALQKIGIQMVDAILFDLGLSSYQLRSKRGFSFQEDEFLDMRMDIREEVTAYDVVNRYPLTKLVEILRNNSDENEALRIAKAIVNRRKTKYIETTRELAEIVEKAKRKKGRVHPATLTFQAIRMEVNREVENLKMGLVNACRILKKRGKIGVISFHSVEDRIVKEFFKNESSLKPVTKKPITPEREEILKNPRSRSAKLRVAEKV